MRSRCPDNPLASHVCCSWRRIFLYLQIYSNRLRRLSKIIIRAIGLFLGLNFVPWPSCLSLQTSHRVLIAAPLQSLKTILRCVTSDAMEIDSRQTLQACALQSNPSRHSIPRKIPQPYFFKRTTSSSPFPCLYDRVGHSAARWKHGSISFIMRGLAELATTVPSSNRLAGSLA